MHQRSIKQNSAIKHKQPSSSLSNPYFEEYSFNDAHAHHRISNASSATLQTNQQLIYKYQSLYDELKHIDTSQLINLFLEEIQSNEQNRVNIRKLQIQDKNYRLQIDEISKLLKNKNDEIKSLKQKQLKYQRILQSMKNDPRFHYKDRNEGSYFQMKYEQLEKYMNQYISSNNQAQDQLLKFISIIRQEKKQLTHKNQQLQKQLSKMMVMNKINRQNLMKYQNIIKKNEFQERKYIQLQSRYNYLMEENDSLKKDLQNLIEVIKNPTEESNIFIKDIQNREFSSSLQFLKEKYDTKEGNLQALKMKQNRRKAIQNQSKMQKQQNNDQLNMLTETLQKLQQQNFKLLQSNQQLIQSYRKLKQSYNNLNKDHFNLLIIIQQKNKSIEKLMNNTQLKQSKTQFQIYQNKNITNSNIKNNIQDNFLKNSLQSSQSKCYKKQTSLIIPDNIQQQNKKDYILKQMIMNDSLEQSSLKSNKKLIKNKSISSQLQKNMVHSYLQSKNSSL